MSSLWHEIGQYLSVWYTSRAAGLTAYLLLFVAVSAGLLQGSSFAKGKRKAVVSLIHQWCGWFGLLFGMVHGLVLMFDDYIHYSIWNILIPFTAPYKPVLTGLGTITLYLFLIIMLSSDMMKKVGKKVWRAIHFLALPTYGMALMHGMLLGTDVKSTPIFWMYIVTATITFVLLFARIFLFKKPAARKPATSKPTATA
ncbi:ferric reductase-like transmembrane domain-containing protein [Paenibacillus hunanensis]|uniref:ferric reductase-like transmembrane domain-containing protein n=1 Tax=Paenibacillus hunanensis TaxID=539262 RepID=UPI002A6A727E|nr:ferric reductase-like transmembrane domain-containing protein [Paenibacillus hunanensis]WPP39431.1 ferric reductase-like transmembrane domain-containing protein [Paenibacillus hunanensis]